MKIGGSGNLNPWLDTTGLYYLIGDKVVQTQYSVLTFDAFAAFC